MGIVRAGGDGGIGKVSYLLQEVLKELSILGVGSLSRLGVQVVVLVVPSLRVLIYRLLFGDVVKV